MSRGLHLYRLIKSPVPTWPRTPRSRHIFPFRLRLNNRYSSPVFLLNHSTYPLASFQLTHTTGCSPHLAQIQDPPSSGPPSFFHFLILNIINNTSPGHVPTRLLYEFLHIPPASPRTSQRLVASGIRHLSVADPQSSYLSVLVIRRPHHKLTRCHHHQPWTPPLSHMSLNSRPGRFSSARRAASSRSFLSRSAASRANRTRSRSTGLPLSPLPLQLRLPPSLRLPRQTRARRAASSSCFFRSAASPTAFNAAPCAAARAPVALNRLDSFHFRMASAGLLAEEPVRRSGLEPQLVQSQLDHSLRLVVPIGLHRRRGLPFTGNAEPLSIYPRVFQVRPFRKGTSRAGR